MPPPQPIVYDNAVEGLYVRGLTGRVTPSLKRKLLQAGIDLDRPLKPQYPREVWIQCLALAAEELFPSLALDEAYRRLGELAVSGVSVTLVGKAIVSMARLLGPRRSLPRLTQAFGSLNNFMTATVTQVTPTRAEVFINDVYGRPTYLLGGFVAVLRICHSKEFDVQVELGPGEGATFQLSWKD